MVAGVLAIYRVHGVGTDDAVRARADHLGNQDQERRAVEAHRRLGDQECEWR